MMMEKRRDRLWLAEQPNRRINQVRAQFEHRAALELTPFRAPLRRQKIADICADQKDVAEPTFASGFENGSESWMIAPHISGLKDPFLFASQSDHFLHVAKGHGRRLLDVHVFARSQSGQPVASMVPDRRLDDDQLRPLECFFSRYQFCAEVLTIFASRLRIFSYAN